MGRRILLGVTGSIAAYKAVELLRLFVKNGDEVQVVMTEAATKFVAPLTFQTLSRNPVSVDSFAPVVNWKPEHISLADWADVVVVAPAMNTGMWEAAATQENVAALKARGVTVIDPASGELACGASGAGRIPEAAEIFAAVQA